MLAERLPTCSATVIANDGDLGVVAQRLRPAARVGLGCLLEDPAGTLTELPQAVGA